METSFRTFEAACGCKDAAAVTALYRDLLANGMMRVFADLDAAHDEAFRWAEIGQKSVTAFLRASADAASPPSSAAAEKEGGKTKGAPRIETAHEDREDAAAA